MKRKIANANKKLKLDKVIIAKLSPEKISKIWGGNHTGNTAFEEGDDGASTIPRCNPTQQPTQKTQ